MPRRAGAGHRRLHRAPGIADGLRSAAGRLLGGRAAELRRQGRHGLRPGDAARPGQAAARPRTARVAVRRHPPDPARHALGGARAGRADRLHRVDPRRAAAPPALPRPAHGQGSPRRRARATGVSVEITHPDKLLFPGDGLTKADIADYYETVSEWMLPHVRDRPLSLMIFPDGVDGQGFFQKNTPRHYPDWIKRVEAEKRGGTVNHSLITNADTLVYLVGQNMITPHVWLSRADRLRQPDRVVFDLDPAPGADFAAVRRAARRTGDLLREIGLEPFAQVTGSKGIHVWTPLRRRATFEDVRPFARAVAEVLATRYPEELTLEFRKAERGGRILVDVMRNNYAQTAVPPYALRPRPGAPVATPIAWDELSDSKLRPDRWTATNLLRRLGSKGDPWADIASFARGLSRARKRLEALMD